MTTNIKSIGLYAAIAFAGTFVATPASAGTGCNGVINPVVWGCAPWDNNNGPQYPNWKNPGQAQKKPAPTADQLKNAKLVGNDGASMVAAGGMNKQR